MVLYVHCHGEFGEPVLIKAFCGRVSCIGIYPFPFFRIEYLLHGLLGLRPETVQSGNVRMADFVQEAFVQRCRRVDRNYHRNTVLVREVCRFGIYDIVFFSVGGNIDCDVFPCAEEISEPGEIDSVGSTADILYGRCVGLFIGFQIVFEAVPVVR